MYKYNFILQENGLYTATFLLKPNMIDIRPSVVFARNYFVDRENLICMEVGTQRGDHAEMLRYVLKPKELFLVDCWEKIEGYDYGDQEDNYGFTCERFKDHEEVKIIRGWSKNELRLLLLDYFDFIYIDGGHLKEECEEDIKNSLRIIKLGGVLAGHDYGTAVYKSEIVNSRLGGDVDGAVHNIFYGKYVYGEMGDWWVVVNEEMKKIGG